MKTIEERIEERSMPEPNTGCLLWIGGTAKYGYGEMSIDGKTRRMHVYMWEQKNGPVPAGLELDHVCMNPPCINPVHLEAVTHRENMMRGLRNFCANNARKTHCKNGHEFTAETTMYTSDGARGCRVCKRAENSNYWLRHNAHKHRRRPSSVVRSDPSYRSHRAKVNHG